LLPLFSLTLESPWPDAAQVDDPEDDLENDEDDQEDGISREVYVGRHCCQTGSEILKEEQGCHLDL